MRVQGQQRRFQLGAEMPIHPRRQLPSPVLACRGLPAFHQKPGMARVQHPFLHHLRLIAPEPGSRGNLRRWTLDFLMNLDCHRLTPLRGTRSLGCHFVGRFPGRVESDSLPAAGSNRLGLILGRAFSPFKMAISSFKRPISSSCCWIVSLNFSMSPRNATTQGVCSSAGTSGKGGSFFMGLFNTTSWGRWTGVARDY